MPPELAELQCASFLFFYGSIGECRKLIFLKSRNKKDKKGKVYSKVLRRSHFSDFASYHVTVEGEVTGVPQTIANV